MPNLVYLSPVPLTSFAQRPHKFVEWFGQKGNQVLWIDPYPTRLPQWSDIKRKPEAAVTAATAIVPGIRHMKVRALPVEPLPLLSGLNACLWQPVLDAVREFRRQHDTLLVIGKPSRLALALLDDGGFAATVYDAMDDFPAFYDGLSRRSMSRRERSVADKIGSIWVSSTELARKWQEYSKVLFVPNACDLKMLPAGKFGAADGSVRNKAIGYVGTMGQWFDWQMLANIAAARPDMEVHLVGPVFTPPAVSLPVNVKFFPPCAHEDALGIMQSFAVGLIPFKLNRLTDGVDPIKYYEYRALGLQVLSSEFGEMREHAKRDRVFIMRNDMSVEQIGLLLETALQSTETPEDVRRFRDGNSWQSRFDSTRLL